jgi:hypothetical protein
MIYIQSRRKTISCIHLKKRKAKSDWSLLTYECLLKHVIEGNVEGRLEVKWRRGIRRKQRLNDLKEMRGYWKFEEEALDRTLWRTPLIDFAGMS